MNPLKKDKIVLYMHAGSGNHGCEAIANTVCRMLPKPAIVVTNSAEEDEAYSLKGLCTLVEEKKIRKTFLSMCIITLKRGCFMTRKQP